MKKVSSIVLVIVLMVVLASCKAKQAFAALTPETAVSEATSPEEIIAKHYQNQVRFSTVYIKSNVRFSNEKQTQNVTAEIKIKKDELILVSIRFLGITMAKALITPSSVSYYEKMNGSYFEGDFSGLTQWLGTDLDFTKIQNMLLGEAFDNLQQGKYALAKVDEGYELTDLQAEKTLKSFLLDQDNFRVQAQTIGQPQQDRSIAVGYSNHSSFSEGILPLSVLIQTFQAKGKTEISLNYTTVTFNEALSFPYSIPNDYKRSIIK